MMRCNISSNHYVDNIGGERFDVLKFLMAIFVVAVHTTSKTNFFHPLMRMAVPLFLIMTSYFFFMKQNTINSDEEKRDALIKYIKRLLLLYLFWFMLLFPYTLYYQKWNVDFGFGTIFVVLWDFIFKDTFRASWFLTASLFNVIFVWLFSRRIKELWLLVIGVMLYLICCLFTNYYNILLLIPNFEKYYSIYLDYFMPPYLSYPVAFLFVVIGKVFADHHILISNQKLGFLLFISLVCLFVEDFLVVYFSLQNADDCFLSMIPLSLCVFMIVGQNAPSIHLNSLYLRSYSTIIYCCHLTLTSVVRFVLKNNVGNSNYDTYFFVGTLSLSILVATLIMVIEKNTILKFVRYSY